MFAAGGISLQLLSFAHNISLVREAAQTMKYDSNGNVVSVTTSGLNADQNTYDDMSNLTSVSVGGSSDHQYTYNYTNTNYPHRITSVHGHYIKQVPAYDDKGNVTSTQIINQSDATIKRLKASKTYSTSGNLVLSETDANGITTSYTYGSGSNNVLYGIPQTTTDGRITGAALANTASSAYTYSNRA